MKQGCFSYLCLVVSFTLLHNIQASNIDTSPNRSYVITATAYPKTYYIQEFINNRLTKKGKFKIQSSRMDQLKDYSDRMLRPFYLKSVFAMQQDVINVQKDSNIINFEKGHLIDTLLEYNLSGGISRIILLQNEREVERLEYNGNLLVQHSKLAKGSLFDTTFSFEGYRASILNKKYKVIRLTKYHNGQFDVTIIDPRKTFKEAEYLNLNTGNYYNMPEYNENDRNAIVIQKLSKGKYSLKVNKIAFSRNIQYYRYIIEKRSKGDKYNNMVPCFDQNYRCVEMQIYNRENEMLHMCRYDKRGFITFLQQKYPVDCYFDQCQPIDLTINKGKQNLYYKSKTYCGTLTKENATWIGIDTLYLNNDTLTTKLQIADFNLGYERHLNGKFLTKGSQDCYQCDVSELNYFYGIEEGLEFAGNTFFKHLDQYFHNSSYLMNQFDSLNVGKDSFVQMKMADSGFHIKLFTSNASQKIFSQRDNELNIVKDQNNCLMGAIDQTGKTIIPYKYETIEAIYLTTTIRVYFCFINGYCTVLNNDGSTIIRMRRGLTDRVFNISEDFRSKYHLLIPFVFVFNDIDSFSVITFSDEILLSGKGRFEFIGSNHYRIITDGLQTLMHTNGRIIGENATSIDKILPDLYIIKQVKSKIQPTESSTNIDSNATEVENRSYIYTLKDLKGGALNSLEFEECINIGSNLKILKKKGMTLFINEKTGIYQDTANLEFKALNDLLFQIQHYKQYGLIDHFSLKTIPAKYSSIVINGTTIHAQRGDTMDIYNWEYDFLFSLHIQEEQKHIHSGIQNRTESYQKNWSGFERIGIYKIKLGKKFGLFDKYGHEILKPEYEYIKLVSKESEENNVFYNFLNVYNDEILIKTFKDNTAELLVLRGHKTLKLTIPVMWECESSRHSILVDTTGAPFPSIEFFMIDYNKNKITIFDEDGQSIKSELDVWGHELFNASKFEKVKTIDGLMYVQLKNGKCGILNNKREFGIEPIYSDIYLNDRLHLLWFKYGYPNEKWKLIHLKNNVTMSDSFDYPFQLKPDNFFFNKDTYFPYIKDGKYGIMCGDGKVEIQPDFDQFTFEKWQFCVLAKNKVFYSWNPSDRKLYQLEAKSMYHSRFEKENKSFFDTYQFFSHAYNGSTMYILQAGLPLITVDSSNVMFFNKNHSTREDHGSIDQDHSISPFIRQQKNNLAYINRLIKSTIEPNWQSLLPMNGFPNSVQVPGTSQRIRFNYFSNTIRNHVIYNNYTLLDYTHLKDKKMSICSNGAYTLSFEDENKFRHLNIYIDSLLGYLVFDLKDVFKVSGADSLTEKIRSKWMMMDDPDLPCIARDKIFDNFINQFTIDIDAFIFRISTFKFIRIPISELKPYMTEFWKKRF